MSINKHPRVHLVTDSELGVPCRDGPFALAETELVQDAVRQISDGKTLVIDSMHFLTTSPRQLVSAKKMWKTWS